MSLKGQVALVTGASRGCGRGIALQLGQAGAMVYITALRLEDEDDIVKSVQTKLPTLDQVAEEVSFYTNLLLLSCSRLLNVVEKVLPYIVIIETQNKLSRYFIKSVKNKMANLIFWLITFFLQLQ
jgi:short-subunit dehydrogenase involved in D-alanine esterification of teichoic acids